MPQNPRADLLALQLGYLTIAWSEVELLISGLFARLINDPTGGRIAAAVLNQFARIHHRIEVINDVIDLTMTDPKEATKLKALTGEARRLAGERNRFLHGLWNWQNANDWEELTLIENILTKKPTKKSLVSYEKLSQTIDEIQELSSKLSHEVPPRFSTDHRPRS